MTERIIVTVCTANRPQMLQACLESLATQKVPADFAFSVVVVENDTTDRCAPIVSDVAKRTGVPMHYALETNRGIPFARNRALEEAISRGATWIAFIDDDETARPDWLVKLHSACKMHGAEVATGPVNRIYEKELPYWWKHQSFKPRITGTPITEAATNNVLLATRIAAPTGLGLRFAPELIHGLEDTDFFRRAHEAGVPMIWVDEGYVDEFVPKSRVTSDRLLNRLVMASCSATQMMVLRQGFGRTLSSQLPRALRRIFIGSLATVPGVAARLVLGQRGGKLMYYGITRLAKGAGTLKGLTGRAHSYYHKIDGH